MPAASEVLMAKEASLIAFSASIRLNLKDIAKFTNAKFNQDYIAHYPI